jgi:VWFA-related protein
MEDRSRAALRVTPRGTLTAFSRARFLLVFSLYLICVAPVRGQTDSGKPTAPIATADSASQQNSAELASRDEPVAFKANANLVVVRTIVRDPRGVAVGTLHKEDFQVFDKGKPQVITQFEVEGTGIPAATSQTAELVSGHETSAGSPIPLKEASVTPGRFVAYLFDDVHLEFGDLAHARDAATRHLATLRPTDRAAIFTTSGLVVVDFTSDRAKLDEALLRVQPQQNNRLKNFENACPQITLYEADLIINKNDQDVEQIVVKEGRGCTLRNPPPPNPYVPTAQPVLGATRPMMQMKMLAQAVLMAGEQESRDSLGLLGEVVRNISRMPGERSVVLVSPGFLTPQLEYEYSQIIDQAVRSQVVVNTLDARGLFVTLPGGDVNKPIIEPGDSGLAASKTVIEIDAAEANDDVLAAMADGTGGVFFHNNNDLDEGFRRTAESPEYSYILGFVPQNLKLDGSFHSLKVTLKNPQKFTLQARRGYFAPKNSLSPEEQSKEEIQDAMYSQEEMHDLPVTLHTQFFKASDDDAKLIVLAHVDVKQMHFRKLQGRNDNVLTCVFALFNSNGRFVEGLQKTVTMDLKDETLEHKLVSGITLKTSFDVKPGSYLVRLVVRDAEAKLMSAENGALEIR